MKMTAPVLIKPNEPMQMLELDIDEPGFGEVRVKMAASGVCHSCLHAYDGSHSGVPLPIVLGDEGSGVVESVGEGCNRLKPGDHVVVSWAPDCGGCKYCDIGYPGLCLNVPPFGEAYGSGGTRFHKDGEPVHHYGPSTYGPYIVVPESGAVGVDKDFPLDLAALIGCSVTTGVGAVINTAKVTPGQSVAVFGCGGIGLNAVQGAAIAGAYPIIGIDVLDSKLEAARHFGATHTINLAKEDLDEAIKKIVGEGVDASIVAVGNTQAMEQGLTVLAKRGVEVIVGAPPSGSTISIDPRLLLGGERKVMGSRYGSGAPTVEFPRMVELAMAGLLKLEDLVTKRYAIDEADEAFRALAEGELSRGLIVF